jgi:methyltransferase (TIGR00027 family)
LIARSKYAEDALSDAIRRGVHQYVILGAGLDTFSYRNSYPLEILQVFEVDHPATQAWKREQLTQKVFLYQHLLASPRLILKKNYWRTGCQKLDSK